MAKFVVRGEEKKEKIEFYLEECNGNINLFIENGQEQGCALLTVTKQGKLSLYKIFKDYFPEIEIDENGRIQIEEV